MLYVAKFPASRMKTNARASKWTTATPTSRTRPRPPRSTLDPGPTRGGRNPLLRSSTCHAQCVCAGATPIACKLRLNRYESTSPSASAHLTRCIGPRRAGGAYWAAAVISDSGRQASSLRGSDDDAAKPAHVSHSDPSSGRPPDGSYGNLIEG